MRLRVVQKDGRHRSHEGGGDGEGSHRDGLEVSWEE